MAKTSLTQQGEKCLWHYTYKMGTFRCFEVTIGFNGDYRGQIERVDFMTYETDGTVRCYEIKVSLSDLKSKAEKTFLGDFNYLVMPKELYEQMKYDKKLMWSFNNIGIYVFSETGLGMRSVKKAKKKQVSVGTKSVILESMVRSMDRELNKFYKLKGYWE